jgi:Tfp pilus assembly protein PilE
MNLDITEQIKPKVRRHAASGGPITAAGKKRSAADQFGFTLAEAAIALLIMLVVALGSASLFSFSIYNNSAGADRATSLSIAQQTMERFRSAQFNSSVTDASLNAGMTVQPTIVRDGRRFRLTVTIDDNPATQAIEVNPATKFKAITVTVVPQSIGKGWAFGAGGTITLFTQRSRSDR